MLGGDYTHIYCVFCAGDQARGLARNTYMRLYQAKAPQNGDERVGPVTKSLKTLRIQS